jgi:23S rRNA (cytosine1962-C5)-methyltransferase
MRWFWHEGRIAQHDSDYQLLDSGGFQKLERFGDIVLARPCAQAVWQASQPGVWRAATATFSRENGNRWEGRERLPATWIIAVEGVKFQLSSTDFGHLGIFPEQRDQWRRIAEDCAAFYKRHGRPARVLNLFAYSGGSTLAAACAGAEVCHVDASKGMVEWARKNAALNGLQEKPVRWIVDDVTKFLERELRRGQRYDLLILDPPSYGRGAKGEVFKIEHHLPNLLSLLAKLFSAEPLGVLISCHTPELTPISLHHLLHQAFGKNGALEHGEMLLRGDADVLPVPSGSFCRWTSKTAA